MMADIRPMNFGELLDASLTIYRRHFGLFLKLAITTLSLPVCLAVYFGARFLQTFTPRAPNVSSLLPLVPVGILYYLAALVLTAGTVRVISESYLGRSPELGDALALGLAKLGSLVGVGLGKGVVLGLIMFGTIALTGALAATVPTGGGFAAVGLVIVAGVVGATWFAAFALCGYSVTTPVVVLEPLRSAFDAFGRSWELTRGFKFKVLLLSGVTFLITNTIPSFVFRALGAAFTGAAPPLGIALTAASYVLPLLLMPVLSAVITLMYYDLRVRREAFDLQILSHELGIT
jgi:hypothetical protein